MEAQEVQVWSLEKTNLKPVQKLLIKKLQLICFTQVINYSFEVEELSSVRIL